jgi:hypothetical protein
VQDATADAAVSAGQLQSASGGQLLAAAAAGDGGETAAAAAGKEQVRAGSGRPPCLLVLYELQTKKID